MKSGDQVKIRNQVARGGSRVCSAGAPIHPLARRMPTAIACVVRSGGRGGKGCAASGVRGACVI
eukprot:scaffold65880_cov53-Phaeocystis_antarctica.AAC.2